MKIKKIQKGFTILEIVSALIIFFIGCLFLFKMFHLAIWASGSISDDLMACIIARKKLEALRSWTYELNGTRDNFSSGDWDSWNEREETDPDCPRFKVKTFNMNYTIKTPSSYIIPHRVLTSSAKIVKVEVSWITGGKDKKFDLVTVFGEPRRKLYEVKVYPDTPIELDPYASCTFTAEALDEGQNTINDLTFYWYPMPETATGTLSEKEGTSVDFYNQVYTRKGTTVLEGTCRVSAGTKSGGIEKYGISGEITLYPDTP